MPGQWQHDLSSEAVSGFLPHGLVYPRYVLSLLCQWLAGRLLCIPSQPISTHPILSPSRNVYFIAFSILGSSQDQNGPNPEQLVPIADLALSRNLIWRPVIPRSSNSPQSNPDPPPVSLPPLHSILNYPTPHCTSEHSAGAVAQAVG